MDLIRLAIRQPVTITVGVLLIILAGAISLGRLPIQLTPNVESTVVSVTTFWEGASPEEIERNIVDKQEERLAGLNDLRLMTSSSMQGQGKIRLEFYTGKDVDEALREVTQKINEVPSYPDNVDEPVIEERDFENRDYIAWIVFGTTDPDLDIRTLRDFAVDRIEPFLENVKGIAEVSVVGGRERELQIQVDPVRLAQYGISPSEFVQIIRDTNQNISAGQLADGKRDVRLRTVAQYKKVSDIERTVIRHTKAGNVLLSDVADVYETFKEANSFVRSKGRQVIAINAERKLDSNVMQVMEGLQQAIADLNQPGGALEAEARLRGLNGDLYLEQVYDQTVYIEDALALVRTNIWLGGGLATIVLLLFLRSFRTVGVIALAIPISVIGAVVVMVAMGRSVNVISLAGMAFAVGMVVDNAIVVLENIFRHIEMGKTPMDAAYQGAREVWGAVLASTLTTIAVFIPILLVQEEAGQLFRDIALAICAAVALSLIVSITVIPCAAARVLKPNGEKKDKKGARKKSGGGISAMFANFTYAICGSTLLRLLIISILTTVSIAGTILLKPPADYLPKGNRNLIFGLIIPPPGYNIDQRNELASRVEQTIHPFWEAGELMEAGEKKAYTEAKKNLPQVPTFNWMTQQPGEPVVPPGLGNYFLVSFEDILFHGGVAVESDRVVDLQPLFQHATRAEMLPDTMAFAFQTALFQQGGSTGSAIKLQLVGPDLNQLIASASAMAPRLFQNQKLFGQVQPVPSNFNISTPEIQVAPDLVRMREIGLTVDDIGYLVQMAGDGAIIDEYSIGGETIDLKVISKASVDQDVIDGIADTPVATSNGGIVPISAVSQVYRMPRPQQIERAGRQRAISFEVTPAEGVALEAAINELESIVEDLRQKGAIPPTIVTSMAGSASKLQDVQSALLGDGSVMGTLGSSLVLALLVVYLLMCVLFQSFSHPFVIMFSVPLATVGGFIGLFIVFMWSVTDRYLPMQMLDVLTMLGFILLIGVVVNNAILIVHQTLNFLRGDADVDSDFEGEMTPRRAISEAVRTRIRPIFMSMLTSVGGMLPLVLMPGSGSELYRGLGSVVVGGLLVSTIFTLLLVPTLLSLIMDVTHKVKPAAYSTHTTPSPRPQRSEREYPTGVPAGSSARK